MDNYIDLSNLPVTSRGIDWKNIKNIDVNFCYRDTCDKLTIVENINSDLLKIRYNNIEYEMQKECLKHCNLGKIFNFAVKDNYKFNIGQIVNDTLKIDRFIRINKAKAYDCLCLKCKQNITMTESNIILGKSCGVCDGHKVSTGFNDLWSTHEDIAIWLKNPEDGYKYSYGSNVIVDIRCPYCHSDLKPKQICDITRRGINCPVCGDKNSYPNKFMDSILRELNIDYDSEFMPEWCKFIMPDGTPTFGRYDFVLNKQKSIIEMDSGLGHGNNIYTNSSKTKEDDLYRDNQKDILALKNGYKVIRINCEYYGRSGKDERFNICKNAIINSELNNILDLSFIDFDYIDKICSQSFIHNACNLYNDGYTITDISKKLNKGMSTIIDYLHKGNSLGLCEYNPKYNYNKIKEAI